MCYSRSGGAMEKRVRTFIAAHTSSQGDATLDATISGRRHGCAIRVLSWPWLTPVMSCATLRLCNGAGTAATEGASGEIGWRHADWSNFRNGAKSALLSPRGTGKTSHTKPFEDSPLGAQPQSDRILRLPCGRLAAAAPYTFALDALKRACRSSSLQASRSARSALSGCRGRW